MSNFVAPRQGWRQLYSQAEQLNEIILLNAGYVPSLTAWNVRNCIQDFWVLWYNFAPGCSCISGNTTYELTPDKILLIPPNTFYSGLLQQATPHFFIWFKTTSPFEFPERRVCEISAQPFLQQLLQAVNFDKRTRLCLFNLLSGILLSLPENFFNIEQFKIKSRKIEQALNIIASHRGRISNTQIAEQLHISPIRFSHLFKSEVGISPQRYCLQIKMAMVEQFLLLGWNIEDIAVAGGFADRYHFSKEFKKYNGISPGKWQKLFSKQTSHK